MTGTTAERWPGWEKPVGAALDRSVDVAMVEGRERTEHEGDDLANFVEDMWRGRRPQRGQPP